MFMGLCPGNAGMTNIFDMARGESQRDFADTAGTMSRAMVEGLFGVKPDALAGKLTIEPGFPDGWNSAAIKHPDIGLTFSRSGAEDTYRIEQRFPREMDLRFVVPARLDRVGTVTINGRDAGWRSVDDAVETPRIEIIAPFAAEYEVKIEWKGRVRYKGYDEFESSSKIGPRWSFRKLEEGRLNWLRPLGAKRPIEAARKNAPHGKTSEPVNLSSFFNDSVANIFKNEYLSPRSPFVSLAIPKQGIGSWAHWDEQFEVDDAGLRKLSGENGGKIKLPNGVEFLTPFAPDSKNIVFTSQWDNYPRAAEIPLSGSASHIYLLMAGSTNQMQSRMDNGEVVVTYTDGSTTRLALNNPVNWWPIDQDYFIDDFAFRGPGPMPTRIDLKTGNIRIPVKGKGGKVPGGSATMLDMPLDKGKQVRSLKVRTIANEVVIGLMAVTLARN
jgi:hypothetical protein